MSLLPQHTSGPRGRRVSAPKPLREWASFPSAPADVGFILADLNLDPIYANLTALDVLTYPDGTEPPTSQASGVRERLRSILNIDTQASYTHPAIFISGKREYVCRPFLLDARDSASRRRIVALLLERTPGGRLDIAEFCRRHRLTARERETLEHLIQGLRTREIAALMNISPNTVKQFIKFIGSKVGASTRSGIVGKVMSS